MQSLQAARVDQLSAAHSYCYAPPEREPREFVVSRGYLFLHVRLEGFENLLDKCRELTAQSHCEGREIRSESWLSMPLRAWSALEGRAEVLSDTTPPGGFCLP